MPSFEDTPRPGLEAGSQPSNIGCDPVTISKYEIISQIGEGGMGKVYFAKDPVLMRDVAIKVLPYQDLESEHVIRFQQEAKAASKLNHPGLIMVIDFGLTEAQEPFLVMEYVKGKPFDKLIKEDGPLELEDFFSIFCQIIDAMEHAHRHGVIHRDLKPSNIMIKEADDIKQALILDFGIAKVLDSGDEQFKTKTGQIIGSPLYISPEQINGDEVDARADIYALGCVMYEALTGFPPFKGINALATFQMHLEDKVPKVTNRVEGLDLEGFDDFFVKVLAKNVEDRYQSMEELAKALNTVSYKYLELNEERMRLVSSEIDALAVSSVLGFSAEDSKTGVSGVVDVIVRQLFSKIGGIVIGALVMLLASYFVLLLNRPKDIQSQKYSFKNVGESVKMVNITSSEYNLGRSLGLKEEVRSTGKWFVYQNVLGDDYQFTDVNRNRQDIKNLVIQCEISEFRESDLASLPPDLERLEILEADFHGDSLNYLPKLPKLKSLYIKGNGVLNDIDFSSLNSEKLPNLEGLVLEKVDFKDKDLGMLLSLEKLQHLAILNNPNFTGFSLEQIKEFPKLTVLSLYRCDKLQVKYLRALNESKVSSLNLSRIENIGDKDIGELVQLKVKRLEVSVTSITAAGIKKLKKLMPATTIVY